MTDTVTRHYDSLLAEHYTWMFGLPFAAKVAEQRDTLAALGVGAGAHGTAIDLGCGPGFQSLALADLGFQRVIAVDTSQALLHELDAHKGDRPVETVLADLRDVDRLAAPGSVETIVCMGDTLTHLASRAEVSGVLGKVRDLLQPGGLLVLTFRDLSAELTGLDRFLPVRADADRIMVCVLDYEPETVVVSDLVHVRTDEGWTLRKSSYRKLRLGPAALADELTGLGLAVRRNEPAGRMHAIVAAR
ncbi:class I SAM-dependent methyltransferase [Bradyrhizobium sp. 2TAF24]|uniref:class I SAM-dependent methyltransferase n=1 Tax=Bradyrhizobium sp. 2TAF24 TaxID=3233011 RepID=UPI003F907734